MTKEMYEDLLERDRLQISELNTLTEEQDKHIIELEKENAELKAFINAPHTKGRKTTRGDYIKTVWDLSKKLAKAKEFLRKIIDTPVFNQMGYDLYENEGYTELVEEAEQFLK